MRNLIVVGSANIDVFLRVQRMPQIGETILGQSFYWHIGGKGANQAVGAARLGAPVHFVGKVGNDPFRQTILTQLKKEKVDTQYVIEDAENPSGMAVILVDKNGGNCITVIGGANQNLLKEDVERAKEIILKADVIILQLEIPLKTVDCALRLARKSTGYTILNPAPAAPLSSEILANTDILVPNKDEAEKLSGIRIISLEEAGRAAHLLLARGVGAVILTLGEQGVLLAKQGITHHFPGIPVKPLDTTGAGDAFVAALGVALVQKKDLEEAVKYANYAAALSVTKLGAQASLPFRKELQEFIPSDTAQLRYP